MNDMAQACAVMVWFFLSGCAGSEPAQMTEPPSTATNTTTRSSTINGRSRSPSRQNEHVLGPDERRVVVFVVPGDALVEVDGQPFERRDGVIELVGKVGETHRVRAWKGDKSTETKVVTIDDTGASPSFMDVNELIPAKKDVTGKKNAARFDLTE